MRTYVQKHKPGQQTRTFTAAMTKSRSFSGQSPAIRSFLHLQRSIGNQLLQRMLQTYSNENERGSTNAESTGFAYNFTRLPLCGPSRVQIQPKLTVNKPGDLLEQEADRVADKVMQMSEPKRSMGDALPPQIQHSAEHLSGQTNTVPNNENYVLAKSGELLQPTFQHDMQQCFGHDFSKVRIHTDAAADESGRAMNANAYTAGHDIAFTAGRYAPETHEGRRLIAHELTHVIQQEGAYGTHVDGINRTQGINPISSLLSTSMHSARIVQREEATATPSEVQPATPEDRREFASEAVDFLRSQGEFFSYQTTRSLTEILGQLRTTVVNGLEVIEGDTGATAIADDLRSAYRDAIRRVFLSRTREHPGAIHEPPTLQQLYEQYLDEILPFALPQSRADIGASELSEELTAPLPEHPSSDERERHEAIVRARQRLRVVTGSVDIQIDNLFSTQIARANIPLPADTTARLSSSIPESLHPGLRNVAGSLMNTVLTPDTTVMLALDLTPYGGGYDSYRFTRLDLGSLGIEILIERQGSIGVEGLRSEQRQELQERFDRIGFQRGGGFNQEEFDQVLIGISQIPETRLASLGNLRFGRQESDPEHPNVGGEYQVSTHTIMIFDRAYSGGIERFGRGERPLTFAAHTVVHEIGHALDLSSLRTTMEATDVAQEALLAEFGTVGREYEIPHPREPSRARYNELIQGVRGAESAERAARSRSGARWTTGGTSEVTDRIARGARQPAFRQAARRDSGSSGPIIPTTYPDPESFWQEYFAESFALFQTSPELLQRMRPNVFRFMQEEFHD